MLLNKVGFSPLYTIDTGLVDPWAMAIVARKTAPQEIVNPSKQEIKRSFEEIKSIISGKPFPERVKNKVSRYMRG